MYVPKHFAETDTARLHEWIGRWNFATLVTTGTDGAPFASHLPMLLDPGRGDQGTLRGHLARANPHWKAFDGETPALAIFHGPHAYISPTWYGPDSQGTAVPTWNYVAVHACGVPRIVEGERAFLDFLADLSAFQEAGFATPWTMDKMAAGLPEKMLRGIVHIEIEIDRLEGKAKLGQNRDAAQREGAVAGLRDTADPAAADVAALMAALDE